MVELSKRTLRVLELGFPETTERETAARMLLEDCADGLPLLTSSSPEDLERIRFAAIKLSEGDLHRLREAIELAKVDWRDLLMNAGFGFRVDAHERWYEEVM